MTENSSLVNLLPPEVQERRRAEAAIVYILAAVSAVVLLLVGVYSLNFWRIMNASAEVSGLQAKNQRLSEDIAEFQVYERRKAEVQARKDMVSEALTGEIAWHRILNEISMVIPADVTLNSLDADSTGGVTMQGYTPDFTFDAPDIGHKPVARWLVRLGEIQSFSDIWLSSSQKAAGEARSVVFSVAIKLSPAAAAPATAPPASSGE